MAKTRRLALMLLAALLLLTGCAGPARNQAPADLNAVYQAMEQAGVLPDMVAVPQDMLPDFYGIQPEMFSSAVFMVSADSLLADEVVLIRAKDGASAAKILSLLHARMAAKAEEAQAYSPEQYAVIRRGQVLSKGQDLALIVSPQAEKLLALYRGQP